MIEIEAFSSGNFRKYMKFRIQAIVILLTITVYSLMAQYKGNQCIKTDEYIYAPEDVSFPSCHASTIAVTGQGLIAAWFGGTAERNPDVGIWISRNTGGKWSGPVEVANGIQHKDKRYPCWNPVLYNSGREILLFFKTGPSPSTWWGEMMSSADGGLTWSRPYRLPEDIFGPIKNKPVLISGGELLCPSSTEDEGWRLHMEFTSDNGKTWERTAALNDRSTGAIQPSILFHPDGRLQLVCRSTSSGILTSWSSDKGRTWEPLESLALPNNNSGIDAVTLADGRHLMIYNHLRSGRNVLNGAISENGTDWKAAFILESEVKGNEFSYPAVIQAPDGLVHITYTWKRKLIKHVVIDPGKIVPKPFVNGEWPE